MRLVVSPKQVREEYFASEALELYLNTLADKNATSQAAKDASIDLKLTRVIMEAQADVERKCEVYLSHTVIKTPPVDAGMVRTTKNAPGQFDKLDTPYPFIIRNWNGGSGRIRLRKRPIVSVQRVAIRYGQTMQALGVLDFPDGWISPESRMGIINIMPIVGMSSSQVSSLIMLPIMAGAMNGRKVIPTIVTIDYTAGFLPVDFDPDEDDPTEACPDFDVLGVLEAVKLLAASKLMLRFGLQSDGEGGSISLGGLSETITPGRFKQIREEYETTAKDKLKDIKSHYAPPPFMIT